MVIQKPPISQYAIDQFGDQATVAFIKIQEIAILRKEIEVMVMFEKISQKADSHGAWLGTQLKRSPTLGLTPFTKSRAETRARLGSCNSLRDKSVVCPHSIMISF